MGWQQGLGTLVRVRLSGTGLGDGLDLVLIRLLEIVSVILIREIRYKHSWRTTAVTAVGGSDVSTMARAGFQSCSHGLFCVQSSSLCVGHDILYVQQNLNLPSLFSGKYLNVVRECGHDVTCPVAKEIIYTLKERAYVEQIEKAFNYASKVLLDFLMEEQDFVAHLRCALLQC